MSRFDPGFLESVEAGLPPQLAGTPTGAAMLSFFGAASAEARRQREQPERELADAMRAAQLAGLMQKLQAGLPETPQQRMQREAGMAEERTRARELMESLIAEEEAAEARRQAFQLQRIGAQERVRRTPTARAEAVAPIAGVGRPAEAQPEFVGPPGELAPAAVAPSAAAPPTAISAPRMATDPMLLYLESRRQDIPARQYVGLRALAEVGALTGNQLIEQVEDAARMQPQAGRTQRDVEVSIARLEGSIARLVPEEPRRRLFGGEPEPGPTAVVQQKLQAQLDRERQVLQEMRAGTNPARAGTATAQPAPAPEGKPLTREQAMEFLRRAGGDKEQARRLAREAGFTF